MGEPRWVVFGAGGMLGTDLVATLQHAGHPVVALRHQDADITDISSIRPHIRPGDIVANCAAYTRVDDAETHRDDAFALNATGPANLARVCADTGAKLVHYSTDYVFGDAPFGIPIPVDASYSPRCVYGESKMAGEIAVRDILGDTALIARVAWLYGAHGRNFVTTILTKLKTGQPLRVVNDQWGQPTWTQEVSNSTVDLVLRGSAGTMHLTSKGSTSWFDFAAAIARLYGFDVDSVLPISSTEYPTPGKRPQWSVLAHQEHRASRPWIKSLESFTRSGFVL